MVELWLGTALLGAGVGILAYSGQDYYLDALGFVERDIADKLRRIRAATKHLRKYLIAWSISIFAVFVGLWFTLDSFPLGLLAAVLLACGPWYLLRRMAETRHQKVEDQLAGAMVTLSSAVKAGLSLIQALEILAEQCPKPISEEFRQIVGEYKLGKPLERTLVEAKDRLKSENLALFTAALLASRESGGKLNETVDRISHSVLEMQRLERKINSETAQARKSAVYMALAPVLILIVYYFVDPLNTTRLFTTLPGQILMTISVVLDILAYLWARAILNPDI